MFVKIFFIGFETERIFGWNIYLFILITLAKYLLRKGSTFEFEEFGMGSFKCIF